MPSNPAENAGSTLFAAEMVLGEGRIIFWEIAGVLRVGMDHLLSKLQIIESNYQINHEKERV
jgi:hypothetical protein